jgi:hypothetical protein
VQISLDKSDRRLLIWTGVILLPLIVVLALLSDEEEDSGIPTTYSAQSSGAKAAYLFLKEEGYDVERWERSPQELPTDPVNTVLVLAAPNGLPRKEEKDALQVFLSRGGRILATGFSAVWFLPKMNAVPEPIPAAVWREYQPELLSPITRAGTIRMSPESHWGDPTLGELVHYSHQGKGIVVSYKVGEGEVIWWAASTPLSNAAIGQAGDLALLRNSLAGSTDLGEMKILWDEYYHSHHDAGSSYIAIAPLQYAFLQCVLIFAAVMFTFGRRNAPIRPGIEPSRLSPLEFVQTLGNLYRRANATRTALEVPYKRFRTLLIRRLGLRNDISSAELLLAARKRLGYQDPDFEGTLKDIAIALQDPDLQEAKVLALAQRLNRHIQNLKLIPQQE